MVDEKHEQGDGQGPFELGRSYDEVGPGLGRLHEAWHVKTGRPALRLFPTDRVEWQPSARWEVLIFCEPSPPSVTLLVSQAPVGVPTVELADVLVLSAAAFSRVEDNARVRAHLASGLSGPEERLPRARRTGWEARGRVVASLALVLGVCLTSRHVAPAPSGSSVEPFEGSPTDAYLGDSNGPDALGYPLPEKPFRHQARAPCPRRKSVVEINGGCWVTLEHKPPCEEDQAEYQGKCYLPGVKPPPLPQSVDP
ncbi:hypothetical protein D187_004651 [Cystobacter fuscus DSM 2262]|uniref:Uncharacterized protein n=1 Tax=Cystobacter fuscus (strain ATCC 25194 / DSM 2262 / NBRC 100088 / M29) TaxID=1242864 RepID=S9P6C4_CYSF2|nr:hypothetical protein [Cystobacter fuscus]EPX57772.1 hypothetical protein D187_004651 [Cystobacter fuscus DSM 2262]